ncbi:hypothetical protein NW752_009463 [Fusarium irregulare]|uniref:Heterokaryon incompatibility domain-containing protein n=1 Tax=Fusarium irregulare TaxID=2494466 RepID=A0A9W8PDC0_9HYPO|nr:hypothetical protein NW766_012743 [Fusarium irregulare]KAJ4009164.1 hypothetical protein NW752_009463 [Fusarium irregulare]
MWLINTSTIKLERANPDDLSSTPYAILSHTWGEHEVTYEDMMEQSQALQTLGYIKILKTCELAREKGISYAWVDTCCIDKRSSAELAEAINSMFRWYKQATVCFAHLEDLDPQDESGIDFSDRWKDCRWFTRGWTLQELIAPEKLDFYDSAWRFRGTKAELCHLISGITRIEHKVLNNNASLESIPLARRMSWAAKRKTTRVEDIAYCLLGIFDVNMPMLYGEGTKAFERLQEEIIKQTTDMSIFAWKANDTSQTYRGILAQSPAEFAHCQHLSQAPSMRTGYETAMTNKGLRLVTFLGKGSILNLACCLPDRSRRGGNIGIYLTKTADGYVRSTPTELFEGRDSHLWAGARYKIFIRKRVTPFVSEKLKSDLAMNIAALVTISQGYRMHTFTAKPADLWDKNSHSFITNTYPNFTGFLDFEVSDSSRSFVSKRIFVVCGLRKKDSPPGLESWAAVYSASDTLDSKIIMDCVNEYYISYGDELYLQELRSRIYLQYNDFPREISVLSSDGLHDLVVSAKLRESPDGTEAIEVIVKGPS